MGNIQEGRLDYSDLKYLPSDHPDLPPTLLDEGDLLFNRTNSAELVGKTAVFHDNHNRVSFASYLIRVSFLEESSPKYVSSFINSDHGRRYIRAVQSQQVGQANVNGTKLAQMPVPLPPAAEQQRIVAEVERRLSVIQAAEQVAAANLRRAERLRQSILKRAFEGKLVSQDPSDEPASVLLERIRGEKETSPNPLRARRGLWSARSSVTSSPLRRRRGAGGEVEP
jgi:type I restriction enzyme S subunit